MSAVDPATVKVPANWTEANFIKLVEEKFGPTMAKALDDGLVENSSHAELTIFWSPEIGGKRRRMECVIRLADGEQEA